MSLEIEDQRGELHLNETGLQSQKKARIQYTRDFLLSLSELDVCKKLASGFDQSLLSEFEDAPQDRYRIPGSLSSQNFRRNEYGSSPPTRGDSSNYSRSIQGRWDSRSSSKSDRDSDTPSDWDSNSRRYGNQSRRPWQVPEHDGLLGSGSFPRPSGYAAGSSAQKLRTNDQLQLNKSSEPYHPPRPYKALPHSRRETNDSFNDETFGSSEFTSEDRAEEERKRRASFESMRKEQHKAFQEKQKLNPEKGKDDFDITLLMEDSKDDKRVMNRSNATDESMIQPILNHDSAKISFPSVTPVSRPLVPPGFSSSMTEKSTGSKSSNSRHRSELGNELEGSLLHTKGHVELSGTSNNQVEELSPEQTDSSRQWLENPSEPISVNDKSEKISNLSSTSDVLSRAIETDSRFHKASKPSAVFESLENSKILGLDDEDVTTGNKILSEPSPARSASILDKLFGGTVTLKGSGSSSFIEQHDSKADDMWSPRSVQSSKFAQWFSEDEKKPVDDVSVSRPNDLLSLIVGGEKSGSQVFDIKANERLSSIFPLQGSEQMPSSLIPAKVENNEGPGNSSKPEVVPSVLTCEDLEQSMLSEIAGNGSTMPQRMQGWSDHEGKSQKQRADIDDRASQHLLALLQKGMGLEDAPSSNIGINSADKLEKFEVTNLGTALLNSKEADAGNVPNSGKPLTLETLFGTAFMKELQSIGGPSSDHRDSIGYTKVDGSDSHGFPFSAVNNGLLASTGEVASSLSSHGSGIVASNQRQQTKSDRMQEHLLEFNHQNEVGSSVLRAELGPKPGGFDGSSDIRLPEEDSLITISDSPNLQNFIPTRNSAKPEFLSIPEAPLDIAGKLAALNSGFRDEQPTVGQEGPPFLRGSYDMRDSDVHYRNLHAQPSSPQLHPSQLNHSGPMFHPLESHPANMNAHMKFMAPENMIHRDTPNHHFPANMLCSPFHHPSNAPTGYDPAPQNPMLQQIHGSSNLSVPHLLRGLPRGAPMPHHPNSQVTGFIQEPNPMQGFPFGQRQPNFGGLGIPPQASEMGGGNNHPEAIQRLIEMELRSNSKQMHPFAGAGHGGGMYGHELDMGFGYR